MISNPWPPRPSQPAPSPPDVTDGWGEYVAAVLGEHSVWIQVLREGQSHADLRLSQLEAAKSAPPPKPPPADRTELWKEINSGLRTFLAVVLVLAFLFGKIDADAIEVLKKAASIAP